MFIAYDVKNGIEYAKLTKSIRIGGKVTKEYINLGRVLDKEKGIYKSRARGIYQYDPVNDRYNDQPDWPEPASIHKQADLILDFGDSFFLDIYIKHTGYDKVIAACGCSSLDTLQSMICYYTLSGTAACCAQAWWEGSYARVLYPAAKMGRQDICSFLSDFGSDTVFQNFLNAYDPFSENADAAKSSWPTGSTLYHAKQWLDQSLTAYQAETGILPPQVAEPAMIHGHLLLAFMSCAISKRLQNRLKNTPYNPFSLFLHLRNQKCMIYGKEIMISEAVGTAKDFYQLFGIQCPTTVHTSARS